MQQYLTKVLKNSSPLSLWEKPELSGLHTLMCHLTFHIKQVHRYLGHLGVMIEVSIFCDRFMWRLQIWWGRHRSSVVH